MTTRPDPRPVIVDDDGTVRIEGTRCESCGHPFLWSAPRCAICGGRVAPAAFGPTGTVWSSTVVRIPVPGRIPPYGLAYVDLHDGPRILAHVDRPHRDDVIERLEPGTIVAIRGLTDAGDPLVSVEAEAST